MHSIKQRGSFSLGQMLTILSAMSFASGIASLILFWLLKDGCSVTNIFCNDRDLLLNFGLASVFVNLTVYFVFWFYFRNPRKKF